MEGGMEKYHELARCVENIEKDAGKFFVNGNKAAGTRARKHLQQLKRLAQELRVHIQEVKNETVRLTPDDQHQLQLQMQQQQHQFDEQQHHHHMQQHHHQTDATAQDAITTTTTSTALFKDDETQGSHSIVPQPLAQGQAEQNAPCDEDEEDEEEDDDNGQQSMYAGTNQQVKYETDEQDGNNLSF